MKHTRAMICAAAATALLASPALARTQFVTSAANAGTGSFRAAIRIANSDPSVTAILFRRNLGTIELEDTVVYTGAQSLLINGRGTEIGSAEPQMFDLFVAEGGGDLTLRNLTFRDGDNGVVVEVPPDAEGQISVSLFDVTVVDNLQFGLSIDEDDPMRGEPFAASISLVVASSHFARNGLLDTDDDNEGDVDAVRVNERGDGDITAAVIHSDFVDNGADGFELDEEGAGDATLTVLNSTFDRNGVTRPDGDDGLDVDESDEGGIWLHVVGSSFNDSSDDGIGIDEEGDGDLRIKLIRVVASGNADSGVSADEGDAGDYHIAFVQVTADANLDKGADMTEAGEGDFDGRFVASSLSFNGDDGIAVEQLDTGVGTLRLVNVTLEGNAVPIDADGVDLFP